MAVVGELDNIKKGIRSLTPFMIMRFLPVSWLLLSWLRRCWI